MLLVPSLVGQDHVLRQTTNLESQEKLFHIQGVRKTWDQFYWYEAVRGAFLISIGIGKSDRLLKGIKKSSIVKKILHFWFREITRQQRIHLTNLKSQCMQKIPKNEIKLSISDVRKNSNNAKGWLESIQSALNTPMITNPFCRSSPAYQNQSPAFN